VTFPVWHRRHERGEILAPFPQPLHLTALGGSAGTGGTPLDAEVVEFANLQALTDAPAASVQGRIAFVNHRMERHRDGSGYGPRGQHAARQGRDRIAARKGAVAIRAALGRHRFTIASAHTGTHALRRGRRETDSRRRLVSNPDADLLANMLKRGEPVKTANWIMDAGVTWPQYTSYECHRRDHADASHPDEVVVIGGHLDSWDLGTGAIDDGAGVAITMAAGASDRRVAESAAPEAH
jgi:carboxypeptidase Q